MHSIIDSHCHIDLVYEKGMTKADIITSLLNNHIESIIHIAADKKSIEFTKNFIKEDDWPINRYYTIGLHPTDILTEDKDYIMKEIHAAQEDPLFKAIGEIGLDFYHTTREESLEAQCATFKEFIQCAKEIKKPICVHTRDAHQETLEILKQANMGEEVLIHCFTGNKSQLLDFLDLGCYISFSGIVTFKNAHDLQDAMLACPIKRMLVETDAPFLTPVPYRGKINHPALVRHTFEHIAHSKKITQAELSSSTLYNTKKFYKI